MHTQRRYSKRELLGQLRVEYLFSVHELPGITSSSSRWEVLGAFLKAGEGRAERLIETDGGLLFLQSIPGRRSTGAIYVYNEAAQVFLWLRFDRDDDLNGADFDRAVWAYRLLQWTTLERMAKEHLLANHGEERGRTVSGLQPGENYCNENPEVLQDAQHCRRSLPPCDRSLVV